jgi:hypothetical protein
MNQIQLCQHSIILFRIFRRLRHLIGDIFFKLRDKTFSTFIRPNIASLQIYNYFSFCNESFLADLITDFPDFPALIKNQTANVIAHRFDLLGSGPVVVRHGMKCKGLEGFLYTDSNTPNGRSYHDWLSASINRSNRLDALRIWSLVDDNYSPIDWQIDFKSGHRWAEGTWYRDIKFGHLLGVDVKVPWELGRMQHLPVIALAACFSASNHEGFGPPELYASEFRNQVLDFMATNPPRMGVNWACPMDVAIRLTNWLVAYDILNASGAQMGDEFNGLFVASIRSHARHIASNLEWSPKIRGNHYLADITGLIFASAYLPSDKEVDDWLTFSINELIKEVEYQFHDDGSNFEGSVSYHRLSAEMVTWASILILNLPSEKVAVIKKNRSRKIFESLTSDEQSINNPISNSKKDEKDCLLPKSYWARLAKMAEFTNGMTKADGLTVQFGDNDSGRFIRLGGGEEIRADNDPCSPIWTLDHRGLISAIQTVLGVELHLKHLIEDPVSRFLKGLKHGNNLNLNISNSKYEKNVRCQSLEKESIWENFMLRLGTVSPKSRYGSEIKLENKDVLADLELLAFSGMGVYVIRGPRMYLAVRCGEIGLSGLGGHTHCDQLAIELIIDGRTIAYDPGTYIYTPLPLKRNEYRSSKAHHVPRVLGREPADLSRGVFDLSDCAAGECIYFGRRGFIGSHSGYGSPVYRVIELCPDKITINDFSENGLLLIDPTPEILAYSQGYGLVMSENRI